MATLTISQQPFEIPDGKSIRPACQEMGVPFDCNTGICGSCRIKVLSGEDLLSELTDEELDLGCDRSTRLACQCRILSGEVEITF